jgi:hypothetical protein
MKTNHKQNYSQIDHQGDYWLIHPKWKTGQKRNHYIKIGLKLATLVV